MLLELGFGVTALHSQMTQAQRISSLARFRARICPLLLTTDIGSRGLDIPEVQMVLNFDVPCCATDYVHRVGRTARAGRGGLALTLATEMDIDLINNIESKIGKRLTPVEDVVEKEVHELLMKVATAKNAASLRLHDTNFGEKVQINKLKGMSEEELAERKRRKRPRTEE
jgi:ATP-dependent RNA helicase DDX49/DBP8